MSRTVTKDIERLTKGLNIVADAVKVTIGPRGKNVVIDTGLNPTIANDGGTIAREINLKDPIEAMGANLIKEVIQKTSMDVGGGRTASAIITQALVKGGLELVNKGSNVNMIKKGMQLAVKDIHAGLDKMARKASKKDIELIATISTESEELGKVIADTLNKTGPEGVVTVEKSNLLEVTSEIEDGLKCNQGYISPYMVNNDRMEAEYEEIPVLITDKKVSMFKELVPTLDALVKKGHKSLLFIGDLEGEALNVAILNKLKGVFSILAIKTPGVGDNKKFTQEDLCALTGAELLTEHSQGKIGLAKKVISRKDSTIIIGKDVKTWITTLKMRRELTENKWEIDQYNERIAKLSNGIAVIKVGAASETELKYLKLKIEDGVNEAKRAMEEGVVPGGDVAFLNAIKMLLGDQACTKEEALGYGLVLSAAEAPLRQIVDNSNGSPDVVVSEIKKSESLTIGYNALDNEIVEDMHKEGIIDAVKVTKTVLQNAVSTASMFLTIDTIIANEPTKDA